jgi:phosphate transport system protein
VIEADEAINDRYLVLESDCIDLLALQQPVASDLRFVASSFKIVTDLERVGDLATNLGTYALADDRRLDAAVDLRGIGAVVDEMLETALDAYAADDAAACRAVADRDDEVDALCERASQRIVRELIARAATPDGDVEAVDEAEAISADSTGASDGAGDLAIDGWSVERLLDDVSRVLLAIRDLERVGDHAVNIAARTLYTADNDTSLLY